MDKSLRLTLCNSLVLPHVDFCVSLLVGTSNQVMDRLQRIICACARLVERRRGSYTVNIEDYGWSSIQQRVETRLLSITFNASNGSSPLYRSVRLSGFFFSSSFK